VKAPIAVALDAPDAETAARWAQAVTPHVAVVKVGLELFCRTGPSIVQSVRGASGADLFLDLKLHDIPNTVARAVEAAAALDVELLTVHAAGGATMMEAARDAAGGRVKLLGVTVLTSLTAAEIEVAWGREISSIRDEVGRLAALAHESGLDGVVASALEASWIRRTLEPPFLIVTPGIRPAGATPGDQKRVATPADAVAAGADYLVVGRPLTQADDPAAALASLLAEVAAAAAT
jgi:orotidine-5'-phosphate decarboxylase